jgi:hypothetical protein
MFFRASLKYLFTTLPWAIFLHLDGQLRLLRLDGQPRLEDVIRSHTCRKRVKYSSHVLHVGLALR